LSCQGFFSEEKQFLSPYATPLKKKAPATPQEPQPSKGNTIQQHLGIFPIASMEGGPLLVVSRVITPINGLVTG